jgi:hypothetical protein
MYKVKTTKGLQGLHAIGDCHRGYASGTNNRRLLQKVYICSRWEIIYVGGL